MRTTLTLDDDVAIALQALSEQRGSLKEVVNDALRLGLAAMQRPPAARRYRTPPHTCGGILVAGLDDIQQLLDVVEGDLRR